MNLNIYLKELKRNRMNALMWTAGIVFIICMFMYFYPILMEAEVVKFVKSFAKIPQFSFIMKAFGWEVEKVTSVLGFYVVYSSIYVILMGSIFSIMLASRILSIEENDKTAEFLLTRPVTRFQIVMSKLLAYLTYLILLNIFIVITGLITINIFKGEQDYSLKALMIISTYSFLIMLTFGAIGFFISILIKRGRLVMGFMIGLVVGCYVIFILSKLDKSTDKIGYISPFKYINSDVNNPDYCLEFSRVAYFLGISLVLFVLTFIIYRKKDIFV